MSTETMSTTEALQEAPALLFTDAAARKVGDLIRGEGNPKLMLRVFVQGGGCSGLQYGFEFDEQIQDGDTCVENLGDRKSTRLNSSHLVISYAVFCLKKNIEANASELH